jgi:hypothetical protein
MENQSSNTNSSTSSDSDYYIAAAMEAPISDDEIDESECKQDDDGAEISQENAELKARIITLKETNATWKQYLDMADDEYAEQQQIIVTQVSVKISNNIID